MLAIIIMCIIITIIIMCIIITIIIMCIKNWPSSDRQSRLFTDFLKLPGQQKQQQQQQPGQQQCKAGQLKDKTEIRHNL